MNNPGSAILDGLSIAAADWYLVGCILLIVLISQIFLFSFLQKIFGELLSIEEYISISLGGWLLPALLLSLFWYADEKIFNGSPLPWVVLIVCLLLSLRNLQPIANGSRKAAALLPLLAGLFLLLRLAYVFKAIVPLYFDSPQHYQYIHAILAGLGKAGTAAGSLPGYYHLGFHFLSAWITDLTQAGITDVMLVLGQIILALSPFSILFIVRHWTHSNLAAFLALVVAAFGWYMPAHAVDWGKYPALASLAIIPFVLSLVYLFAEYRNMLPGRKYAGLIVLLLAGGMVSVLLHSRSLIVYLLLSIAWLVTALWKRAGGKMRFLLFSLFFLILVGEIVFIQYKGFLGPLFDAYGVKAIVIGASVLVLSLFALRSYPGLVLFCIVSILLLLASLFVPLINIIPGFASTSLLDRPYVQMILYLPLTLIAGFGVAGLEHMLEGRKIIFGNKQLAAGKIFGGLLILLVTVNAALQYDFYPSDCCQIASRDDLAAIHWLDENLPRDALILTSSTNMNVLPNGQYQGNAGGDAGTWITPLTGRPVVYLPFSADFSQQQTLDLLCQQGAHYIFVGKTGWGFDDARMNTQPDAYKLILQLPKTRLYQVTACR